MRRREVGIELLRIVAMLMVLGLHANFMALKSPSWDSILSIGGITRTMMQSICIVAVDVFVMISGWFGIRQSLRGFCNFMWQVFYFVAGAYIVDALFFGQAIGVKDIFRCIGLFDGGGWFVASYIGLYIIAPILNTYIEKTAVKNIAVTLAAFFSFEFMWGNTLSVGFILGGYSTFSFIGIYVLAGMLRKMTLTRSAGFWVSIFVCCTIFNTLAYIVATRLSVIAVRDMIFNYINPLVIIQAASLLLLFDKITPPYSQNTMFQRVVLYTASSCFAAYLLHGITPYIFNLYLSGAQDIYSSTGYFALPAMVGYVIGVFIISVILDQPRKLIWNKILFPIIQKL